MADREPDPDPLRGFSSETSPSLVVVDGFLFVPFARVDRPSLSGHEHGLPDSIQFGQESGGCPPHLAFFVRHYSSVHPICLEGRDIQDDRPSWID